MNIYFNKKFLSPLSLFLSLSLSLSISAVLSCGLLLSSNVQARELKSRGVYLDGGFGWGQVAESNIPGLSESNGIGWNVNLGYQFNEFFGAEIGYISLPRVKNNGNTVIKDNYVKDIAVKGNFPISDRLGVYGKVGLAQATSKYTGHDSANSPGYHQEIVPLFAIGASYSLNTNSYIGIEGLITPKKGRVPSMRAVTFNIGYIF